MTTNRIPESAGYDRSIETRTYAADRGHEAGSYEVELVTFDIDLAGAIRPVRFSRIHRPDITEPGRKHNLISVGRPVTVRVGRGVKTYAVSIVLLDVSHKEPGMLAMAGFNALNRQASPIGWVDDRDETNIRSGYGATYGGSKR